jgi:hypothetical protein
MNFENNHELLSQEWQELHETMHETHEMTQAETQEVSGETHEIGNAPIRRKRTLVTPTVIIRISLAPMRNGQANTVFGTPNQIVGATSHTVVKSPISNQPYIPIRTVDTATGRTSGSGMVYVPKHNANVIKVATIAKPGVNSLRQATNWVAKQVKTIPALADRITGVKILSNAKPCKACAQKALTNVAKIAPKASSNLKIRFTGAPTAPKATTKHTQLSHQKSTRPITAATNGTVVRAVVPKAITKHTQISHQKSTRPTTTTNGTMARATPPKVSSPAVPSPIKSVTLFNKQIPLSPPRKIVAGSSVLERVMKELAI